MSERLRRKYAPSGLTRRARNSDAPIVIRLAAAVHAKYSLRSCAHISSRSTFGRLLHTSYNSYLSTTKCRCFFACRANEQLVKPGSVLTTLKRLARERDAFLWAGLGCSAGFVAVCALSLVFGQQTIRRCMHVIMMTSCILAVSPKRRAACYRGTFSRIALCSFAGVD